MLTNKILILDVFWISWGAGCRVSFEPLDAAEGLKYACLYVYMHSAIEVLLEVKCESVSRSQPHAQRRQQAEASDSPLTVVGAGMHGEE
jgi:hypothetical protein